MTNILQIIGFIGTIFVAVVYIPQIYHIIKKKCTMGIDKWAWLLWTVATILILVYAISIKEAVFITLISINLLAIITIFILKTKYGDNICGDCIVKCKVNKKRK